jgi:sulfite reductase alpha subunit-like flavoprotein
MTSPNNNPGAPQGLDPQIITQLHQLTDSLNAQQKSWLGGYLSGLAAQGAPAPAQTSVDSDHLLTILYGSQTGNDRRHRHRARLHG